MKALRSVILGFSLVLFAAAAAHGQSPEAGAESRPQGDAPPQEAAPEPPAPAAQPAPPEQPAPPAQPAPAAQAEPAGEVALKKLIDQKVSDRHGKDLGKIRDIIIDLRAGKVHAAVVSFGGFLGMGNTQYAFPMSDLKPGPEKNALIVDVDKRALEKAEGFAKGQWLGMNPEYWGRHGGESQANASQAEASAGGNAPAAPMLALVRAGALLNEEVKDRNGDKVGKLRDLVVTPGEGRLKHALVDVDRAAQTALPTGEIIIGVDNKLVVNMTVAELRGRAPKPQPK